MPATKRSMSKQQRELVMRALTDPKFRKALQQNPEEALGVKGLEPVNQKEIAVVLALVKGIDAQIAALADELLCAGGGCSIGRA